MVLRMFACATVIAISTVGLQSIVAGPKLAPASAPPATFSISMPDYHRVNREVWIGEAIDVSRNLRAIADEALKSVSDGRLNIDERTIALSNVELFSAKVTAATLIESIELEDNRGERIGDSSRGRYPVVTTLAQYGEPAVEFVNFALSNEDNPKRKKLMCEVLDKAVGSSRARQLISSSLENHKWTPEQRRRLQSAIEDLLSREGNAEKR